MDFASRFLGGYGQGRADRQQADAQAKQEKINALLGQAYADPSQRDAALAQVAPLDAGMALQADEQFAGRDDRLNKGRANLSRILLNAPPEARPKVAQRFAQDFQRLGMDPNAPDFEDSLTAYASYGAEGSPSGKVVGNALVDPVTGRVIYKGEDQPVNGQIVNVPDGQGGMVQMVFDPRTRKLAMPEYPGGQPQSAPDGMAAPTGPVQADGAEQIVAQIEAAQGSPLAPEIRAQILADVQRNGGRVDTGSFQPMSNGPAAQPPRLGRTPPKAQAGNVPSGYRLAADGQSLEAIPGGPADKPAADKPLPVGALRLQLDATESLSVAEGVDAELARFAGLLESGELDLGPIANLTNQARNAAGASTPQSQNYASFVAGLEKLRNDSLRLNKGVQTDGDAQRAWNELVANINDAGVVKQRLAEIRRINARGEALQREKLQLIDRNYRGKEAAAPEDDISDLLQLYGDDI